MTGVVAGWYPDAEGVVRWWDGTEWTDRVQTDPTSEADPQPTPSETRDRDATVIREALAAAASSEPAPPPRERRPLLLAALGALVLLVVAAIVVGLVVVGGDDTAEDPPVAVPTSTTEPTTAPTTEPTTAPTTAPTAEPTAEPTTEPPPPTETPDPAPEVEAVADDFVAAVIAVDCPTVERLSTPAYLDRQGRCDPSVPDDRLARATYTREPAAVAGASATVMAVITTPADGERPESVFRFTLTLVNTALGWRVNDLAAAS